MTWFFIFGGIVLAAYLTWKLPPQVEMTDEEKGRRDRAAFDAELRRRHGERVSARNKYRG